MTMYLSAAAAAGASNIPAIIAAGATLAGVALGTVSTAWQQSRASRAARQSAARQQIQEVTSELVASTTELQSAVRLVDARWSSWGKRAPVIGVAVLELLGGLVAKDKISRSAGRVLQDAVEWTQRADEAIVAELGTPTRRVEAALARAVLLADQDVVNAAVEVSEALTAVTTAYGQTQMIPWGKKADKARAARTAADTALQEALGDLIIVARERLHPARAPRWWTRAGRWSRRLVPGGRQQSAISATVPAQRAGDGATVDGTPALPVAPTR